MANLTDVKGVSDSRAEDLRDEGFTTVDDIATASADELAAVSGIGESTAEGLIESAQDVIRDDTLDTSEEEETQEAEAEDEDEQFEVTTEDLQDMIEEDEPEAEPEPDADEESEEEEAEPETDEPFDVALTITSEVQYDSLYHSMVDASLSRIHVNGPAAAVADEILSQMRAMPGEGDVELSLTGDELNTLHVLLRKIKFSFQGVARNEPFHALDELTEQVQSYREQYL